MAIRNVLTQKDPQLVKRSRPVEDFGPRTQTLIDDMIDTMHKREGVGIAAPQVGVLRRVVVVEPEEGRTMVLINPEILAQSGSVEGREGCLSVPHVWGLVDRPQSIKVHAFLRDGTETTFEAQDFEARVICHETDHLEGVLFTDRAKRLLTDEELKEME